MKTPEELAREAAPRAIGNFCGCEYLRRCSECARAASRRKDFVDGFLAGFAAKREEDAPRWSLVESAMTAMDVALGDTDTGAPITQEDDPLSWAFVQIAAAIRGSGPETNRPPRGF